MRSFPLLAGKSLPAVFEPLEPGVVLAEWAAANRPFIESSLHQAGAILFRGFDLHSLSDFETAAAGVFQNLYGGYGDLPRAGASQNIYASTPYPPDRPILFHNESSHLSSWPAKIGFFCMQAAPQCGETPLLDCREVCREMRPALLERFASQGLMYVRNFGEGLDVSWQQFFHTEDQSAVERTCKGEGLECEWKPKNGLRIRHRTQAVALHPRTGEQVFFNQVQLHHPYCLGPEVRASLLSIFSEEDLPRNVTYGDGTRIEDAVMEELNELFWRLSVAFPWREGEMIVLDNMLVAHARNPFTGPRRIVVAMGEMIDRNYARPSASSAFASEDARTSRSSASTTKAPA